MRDFCKSAMRVRRSCYYLGAPSPRERGSVRLAVTATPVTLGVGFAPRIGRTPALARQRMQQDEEYGGTTTRG